MKETALAQVALQQSKCDGVIMKRECNMLRLLIERGICVNGEDSAPPTSPELCKVSVVL